MNRKWFIKKLKEQHSTQTVLAEHLSIDKASVSRLLSGDRHMHIHEISVIAEFLGVDPIEVYEHAAGKYA